MDDAAFYEYLKNPLLFPSEFKDYISDWFALNVPKLHVSQIYGFKLLSVHEATEIATAEATSSTSYTNLTTVGPTLSNLANGFYVVMFGADGREVSPSTFTSNMGVSVDGAAVVADEACGFDRYGGNGGRMFLVDLTLGDNTHELVAKYKTDSGTRTFADRWLHAMRVATE